ncbi:MAG: amino acid ABC transporter ATP-binding protein [Oscillospiraceae bacterium]|nr:amino acid ABC transporter ATP-binding protein [Oscillospiraceae bacterium]
MLKIENLGKRYGDNVILKNINVEVKKGEVISIIGSSGTGKSTFLRAVNFLEPPTEGAVYFDGERITKQNVDIIRRRMGMVFQSFGLFSHLNVLNNVTAGPIKLLKTPKREAEKKAMELLKTVGLFERAEFFAHQLSGGQKQRVAIARCLAMSPEVILFDEPTSALDPTMVSEVMAVMRNLAKSGMTMLVVTNVMSFARDVSSRVLYIDEGGIYEQGTPEDIFDNPQKTKTQIFIQAIRSFNYEVTHHHFDHAQMLACVEEFCFRHAISRKITNRLMLLAEELVINIVTPKCGTCSLNIDFSEKLEIYELSVLYGGEKVNLLDTFNNHLSTTIIKNSAKELTFEYSEDKNVIRAKI